MRDHTVPRLQAKVQREQKWTRNSAIFVRASKIAGTILSSTETAIDNIAVVKPPLVIYDTQPQDPQSSKSPLHALPGDLDLPLHPHPIVEPGPQPQPPQIEPIATLSQKCWPSGEKLGEFFKRRRMRHGLLASASILCKETFSLYCRLRMKGSHGSLTCGTFLVVS
jgi:hypothetical protein